jgi:hypothetical protein
LRLTKINVVRRQSVAKVTWAPTNIRRVHAQTEVDPSFKGGSKEDRNETNGILAIAVVGLAFVAVCSASKAAPVAPLPSAVISGTNNVVPAYYYHHRYYPYRYHGHYYGHYYHGRYW